jgi:GWxTD domain-containing protein
MMAFRNKKAAVDSFWIHTAGSADRARELIRKFYNRTLDANRYFTSYLEGWRTDRGLIYLIYGPPNAVYRYSTGETWIYGEEHNSNSLNFTFTKVINPFSTNDFRLERSPIYQDSWYRATNSWREGRIFLDN